MTRQTRSVLAQSIPTVVGFVLLVGVGLHLNGRRRRPQSVNGSKVYTPYQDEREAGNHRPTTGQAYDKDHPGVRYVPPEAWSDYGAFKESTRFDARLQVTFNGAEAVLIVGVGPDHSIFEVYLDGALWNRFDGYASRRGERRINLQLDGMRHTLDIHNRCERNFESEGYRVQFRCVEVLHAV